MNQLLEDLPILALHTPQNVVSVRHEETKALFYWCDIYWCVHVSIRVYVLVCVCMSCPIWGSVTKTQQVLPK